MQHIFRDTIRHWKRHNAPRMGAALSYYAMLSFVPLLLLIVILASSVFSKELVQGTLMIEITKLLGASTAQYIDGILRTSSISDATFTAAVVSAVITLFGAVGVFTELDQDFDTLWDTPKERPVHQGLRANIWGYVHKKLIAFSFVPMLVVLLVTVIAVTIFFAILEHMAVLPGALLVLIQVMAPLALGTILCAVTYRILPERKLPWRVLLVGAFATTALFLIGNFLIVEYIKLIVHTDVFGGAASLVGLLVWIYYSAQVFFLGASFTYIYAHKRGIIPRRD